MLYSRYYALYIIYIEHMHFKIISVPLTFEEHFKYKNSCLTFSWIKKHLGEFISSLLSQLGIKLGTKRILLLMSWKSD